MTVIGPYRNGPADFEVRTFAPDPNVNEDPVTESANAVLAQWLCDAGHALVVRLSFG